MGRGSRSRLLPAMLALLVATAFGVLGYVSWLEQRRRPLPPLPPGPIPVSTPAPRIDTRPAPPGTLHRCVATGQAAMYTANPCPAGTRLDREIEVAALRSETPDLRRARERCEAGKTRRRLELMKLGTRRVAADDRLWGDYAARECAAYTAAVR